MDGFQVLFYLWFWAQLFNSICFSYGNPPWLIEGHTQKSFSFMSARSPALTSPGPCFMLVFQVGILEHIEAV